MAVVRGVIHWVPEVFRSPSWLYLVVYGGSAHTEAPPLFCGDPCDHPCGAARPLGAILGMGVYMLHRGGSPRAALLHFSRRDVSVDTGKPLHRVAGVGVTVGRELPRSMAGLEHPVHR